VAERSKAPDSGKILVSIFGASVRITPSSRFLSFFFFLLPVHLTEELANSHRLAQSTRNYVDLALYAPAVLLVVPVYVPMDISPQVEFIHLDFQPGSNRKPGLRLPEHRDLTI
jgi:hypothetical protein